LWEPLWKEKNDRFEEFLQGDPNLKPLFGKMFHIWDENHKLQAWFLYIGKVHPFDANWHIYVDSFVLDSKSGLITLLTTMIEFNK
jgi:hypothetical protein